VVATGTPPGAECNVDRLLSDVVIDRPILAGLNQMMTIAGRPDSARGISSERTFKRLGADAATLREAYFLSD
jgi:hypothetical protein